jgi:hypothetical protein
MQGVCLFALGTDDFGLEKDDNTEATATRGRVTDLHLLQVQGHLADVLCIAPGEKVNKYIG